jgi:hypothetical protein
MAYKQTPGRSPLLKTGRGIPLNFLSPLHKEKKEISEADIMNDPAFIKPGGDNIGVNSAGIKLSKKDINTANQLDAVQAAAKGEGDAESFKAARNMKDTHVQSGSFNITKDKGVGFTTNNHINGRQAGNSYVFDQDGNISHSQGKKYAISPAITRLGFTKSN